MKLFSKSVILAAALAFSGGSAHASTFVFGFGSSTNSGAGRIFTATTGSETISVRASAWTYNGSRIKDSTLGIYSGGLGVISDTEGNGSNNRHTIDNQSERDFILLQFDRAVSLDQARFNAFALRNSNGNSLPLDNDATIGYGTTALAWNAQPALNNQVLGVLNGIIPNTYASNGTGASTLRPINTGGFVGNVWMISASAMNPDNRLDGFKFDDLSVNWTARVPEPATWAMMLGGFGFIGSAMRRRRRDTARATA